MSQIHILQTTCFSPKKLGCKLPNPAHFSCLQDGHRVPAPAKPEGGDDGAQPLQVGQGGEGQPAAQPPPVGQDGTQSDSQLQPTELAGPQDQCHSQTAKPTHEKAPEGPPHKDPPHEHPPQEVLSDEDPETEQPVQPMQPLREDVIYSSDVKTVMSTEVAEDLCDTKGGDKNGQSKSGKGKGSDCVATAMGDSVEAHLGGKSPGVPEVVEMQPPPLPEVVEMQPLPPLPPPQTPPPPIPPKPKLCLAGKGPAVLVPVPKMLMKDKGKTKARPGGVGNMHGSSVQPELEPDPQPVHPEAFTWETRKLRRTEQSSTKDEMEVVTVEDDEDGNYDEWAEWDEDEQTSAKWQQDKKVDEDVMEEEDQTWGAYPMSRHRVLTYHLLPKQPLRVDGKILSAPNQHLSKHSWSDCSITQWKIHRMKGGSRIRMKIGSKSGNGGITAKTITTSTSPRSTSMRAGMVGIIQEGIGRRNHGRQSQEWHGQQICLYASGGACLLLNDGISRTKITQPQRKKGESQ